MSLSFLGQRKKPTPHFDPVRRVTLAHSFTKPNRAQSAQADSLSPWIGVVIIAAAILCGLALPWV